MNGNLLNVKKLVLGTIAYTVCTFSLAVGWHVFLFKERYEAFGYFEGEARLSARSVSPSCSRAFYSLPCFRC